MAGPVARDDPYDLARFVDAQRDVYAGALAELAAGRKRSHWMWFVFPQIEGLGSSWMAQRYAISDAAEAEACLRHRVLGPRLIACAEALLAVEGRTAREILGSPDDLKLKSSATLFAAASSPASVFERVLDKYFAGERDEATLRRFAPAGRAV